MKNLIIALLFFSSGCSSSTVIPPAGPAEYTVAVSFGSICCGTVSDQFLKNFLKNYNLEHSPKVTADVAAGCGKEGEFAVLFKIDKDKAGYKEFVTELQKLVETTDAANKSASSSAGTLQITSDPKPSDYLHCRLGIKSWP